MPVTIDADDLATALGVDLPTATRLLAVASAVATNYASAAPDAVLDEAVRMIAGWIWGKSQGSVKSEAAGPFRVSYNTMQQSPLRHSGAMALLSPYRSHRAAVIA